MIAIEKIGEAGTNAVKGLRLKKLDKGLPFMINSKELPDDQCYLEYPDRSIKLVQISATAKEFIIVKELTSAESKQVRSKFHLA